jgi:hypothetical protein
MIQVHVKGQQVAEAFKPLVAWRMARQLYLATKVRREVHLVFMGRQFTYQPHRFDNFVDWYNELRRLNNG